MITAAVLGAWRSFLVLARSLANADAPRLSADRLMLEDDILPRLAAREDVRRLLFVGCARYTRHYGRFFPSQEYWTIDPSARRRRWGAERHIIDRLEHLGRHASPAAFDVIICNGVLGWGLNARDDAEAAFAACHAALRPGGQLIVGWNDVRPHNTVRPDSLQSLARFDRAPDGSGRAPQVRIGVPHRHVFEFYRKPGGTPAHGASVVGASGEGAHADSGLQTRSTHNS